MSNRLLPNSLGINAGLRISDSPLQHFDAALQALLFVIQR